MSIHPDMRDSCRSLRFREAEKPRDDSRGGKFNEDDVVKSVGIESVAEQKTALNLVGFDEGGEQRVQSQGRSCVCDFTAGCGTAEPVCDGEDGSEVIY